MSHFGDFTADGREYRICEYNVKRPLLNYVWNRHFFAGVNHFGGGDGSYIWTSYYMDPEDRGRAEVIAAGNRYFYIRDQETGVFWNPGWYPTQTQLDAYECVHGIGYTSIMGQKDGIEANLRVYADPEDPAEVWRVRLKNNTKTPRHLQLFSFVQFSLLGYQQYCGMQAYSRCVYQEEQNLLCALNLSDEVPHDQYSGYIASDKKPIGFDSSLKTFLGRYGSIAAPEVVAKGACKNTQASCENFAGVLEHRIILSPGEEIELHVVIGSTKSVAHAAEMSCRLLAAGRPERQFQKAQEEKRRQAELLAVETPDERVNRFASLWLKHQVELCIMAGRGGGKGFRDQLQDAWGMLTVNPALARNKIAEAFQYQYADGHCPRGWMPLDPHYYSDGPVWLALAVNEYVKETGDTSLLEQREKYLDGPAASIWQHLLAAARHLVRDVGSHGLVKIHEGDWNDSLNKMGVCGKGESVWTSIAAYGALMATAELAGDVKKDAVLQAEILGWASNLKNTINTQGWDGSWYLAGYTDEGKKVGSHKNEEGRIYLTCQAWAVFTGVAEGERAALCLKAIDQWLDHPVYGPLTLAPAYTRYDGSIGRITGFIPGIWENSTPYCHGAAFKMAADCKAGRGSKAYETLCKIMPDSANNPSDHSGCEPYAFTNMVLGPENPKAGETLFSWVTGTAGWVYRCIHQYMLGFEPGHHQVRISPAIPAEWKSCSYTRTHRGATYQVEIVRANVQSPQVELDGKVLPGGCFAPCACGNHRIVVTLPEG